MSLLCIAGLGGYAQVSLPLGEIDLAPVGLSFIGPRGGDEALLDLSTRLTAAFANSPSAPFANR